MKFHTIVLFTVFFVAQSSTALSPSSKPNIIFILADDLGYGDLGCYGSTLIKTPNIDALAKRGMRFTEFYAGSTVCAPSRATLMTGKHTGHAYIRGNGEVPFRDADTILPQLLHTAGYRNGMVGKWGLGQVHTAGAPEKKGWDFFSGQLHHVEGHYQLPDSAWQLINGASKKIKIPGNQFANQWYTNEALRFISDNKGNPFFLYVSFTLPHAELVVPNEFLRLYINKKGVSSFSAETPHKSGQHYGLQQYPKAAYAAMISQMDYYTGQIISRLKELQLDENTIVIFTSDNGTHAEGGRTRNDVQFFNSTASLRGLKRDLYEGGIRVPFIIHWGNQIKHGIVNQHQGAFWDIVPTLCEAAGVQPVYETDGISFLPSLLGLSQKKHHSFYWEFYEGGFKQAVRMGKWKAIRFYKDDKSIRTELYDLSVDPGESEDLSQNFPDLLKQMHRIMDQEHLQAKHPLFQIQL